MTRGGQASCQETLDKLAGRIRAGNYYEAQQMYKTVHARYMAAQKYEEALDLVQAGACLQLKHEQVTCGVELGVLLVDTLVKAKVAFESSSLERIKTVFHAFPRLSKEELKAKIESEAAAEELIAVKTRVDGCVKFVRAALKWSIELGNSRRGDPELHDLVAVYIWEQSDKPDFGKASQHFIRGSHPDVFAAALVDCMTQCFPGEADLVIARGILQYLALGNLRDANQLWDEVKRQFDVKKQSLEFADTPLIHFIKFLLLTLERDAVPLFRMLRQNYKASLDRDPSFDEYMDEIGAHFYGLRRKSGVGGIFGDIMKMLTGDG